MILTGALLAGAVLPGIAITAKAQPTKIQYAASSVWMTALVAAVASVALSVLQVSSGITAIALSGWIGYRLIRVWQQTVQQEREEELTGSDLEESLDALNRMDQALEQQSLARAHQLRTETRRFVAEAEGRDPLRTAARRIAEWDDAEGAARVRFAAERAREDLLARPISAAEMVWRALILSPWEK